MIIIRKTVETVFPSVFFLFLFNCSNPPRMVNHYSYLIPKDEVLALCKRAILKLDYDIDIYAPESNILITKSRKIRKVLRRYDYVIYIQVGDKVNVHISAERSIFNRGSESSFGGDEIIIKQPEGLMPYSLQKKIFIPIEKKMLLICNSLQKLFSPFRLTS